MSRSVKSPTIAESMWQLAVSMNCYGKFGVYAKLLAFLTCVVAAPCFTVTLRDADAAESTPEQRVAIPAVEERPPYTKFESEAHTVRPDNLVDIVATSEIVIGNESAAREMAEQKLSVNEHFESLQIIEAATLKADGRRLDVAADNIVTRIRPTGILDLDHFYLDEKITTIQFPQVAAGDRIYYVAKWTAKTARVPGFVNGQVGFDPTERHSSFTLTLDAPAELKLQTAAEGATYRTSERGDRIIHEWRIGAQAYQPPEPEAVSIFDRGPYFSYSSFPDWDALGQFYTERAAPMSAVTSEIAKLAEEITEGRNGAREQAEAIFDWVATNIRYVNIVLGSGGFVPRPATSVIANRYGDCKDHATLMRSLLAAKGIASEYAFINSGRSVFKAYAVPVVRFDHVIVYIPELGIYADPTAKYSTFGALPEFLHDRPVLRSGLGRSTHTRTPPVMADANVVSVTAELTLSSDGKAVGTAVSTATGPAISQLTYEFDRAASWGADAFMMKRMREIGVQGTARFVSKAFDDRRTSASVNVAFSLDEPLLGEDNAKPAIAGPRFIGRPFLTYGAVFRSDRTRDFVCIPSTYRQIVIYHLPAGWRPENLPADVSRTGGQAEFTARYIWADETLRLERTFVLRGSGSVCAAASASEMAPVFNAAIREEEKRLTFVHANGAALGNNTEQVQPAPENPKNQQAEAQRERQAYTSTGAVSLKWLPGHLLEGTETTEILIGTAEGAERMSTRSISVSDEFMDHELIEAATLKADGRRLDVPADKIVTRVFGTGKPIKTIIFPDVAPGDRIRHVERGTQKRKSAPGEGFFFSVGRTNFQPQGSGSLTLDIPADVKLHIANSGYKQSAIQRDGRILYEWQPEPMQYEPEEIDELFVINTLQKLEVSSYADWQAVGEAFCRPAETVPSVTPEIGKLAGEIVSGRRGRLEEAKAIYDWLLLNIADNDIDLKPASWVPNAPTSTLAKRQGNSNDMSALLRALLAARGIEAHFALANSGSRIFDDETVPGLDFSKIILFVPEFDLYADPTVSFSTFGTLREAQYGTRVLRCGPGVPGLRRIPQATADDNHTEFKAELTIGEDGKASGTSILSATGTSAIDLKKFKSDADKGDAGSVMDERLSRFGLRGSARIENQVPKEREVAAMAVTFSIDENLLGENDAKTAMVGPGLVTRPFRAFERALRPERTEGFFCFPQTYRETVVYHLPKGWMPKALPKDVARTGGPAAFTARYKRLGETVEIERTFSIRPASSLCPAVMAKDIIPVVKAAARDAAERLIFVPAGIAEQKQ